MINPNIPLLVLELVYVLTILKYLRGWIFIGTLRLKANWYLEDHHLFGFEIRSYSVARASFILTQPSDLGLSSAEITGVRHYTWLEGPIFKKGV